MMDYNRLIELTALLAKAYPNTETPICLAENAGLDRAEIEHLRRPTDLWHEIVQLARKRDKLERLVQSILRYADTPPASRPSDFVASLRDFAALRNQPSHSNMQLQPSSVESPPASCGSPSTDVPTQILKERQKRMEKIKSLLKFSVQTGTSNVGEGSATIGAELCDKLAPFFANEELAHTDSVSRIAEALVSIPIEEVTAKIEQFIRSERCSEMRQLARKLVWYALPAILSLQEIIPMAKRAAGPQGRNPIELVLNWELTTEIVMAGIDGRACDFVVVEKRTPKGAKVPTSIGAGVIPLPTAEFAPIFNCNAETTVLNIVKNLQGRELGRLKNRYLPDLELEDREDHKAHLRASAYRDAVYHIDKRFARAARDDEHPMRHYLIFIDDEQVREYGYDKKELDSRWNILSHSLARLLPNLRVVRMKHNDENSLSEIDIVDCIEPLLIPVEE